MNQLLHIFFRNFALNIWLYTKTYHTLSIIE